MPKNNNNKKKKKQKNAKDQPWLITKSKQALKLYDAAVGLFNTEYKMFDATFSNTINNTGSITAFTLIVQGDAYNQRQGNSIRIAHISTIWDLTTSAAATTGTFVRLILFVDLNQAGTIPTVANVLQTAANTQLFNNANIPRFLILHDQYVNLNTVNNYNRVGKLDLNYDAHIKYLDGTANQTGQGIGNIYYLAISSQATNVPTHNLIHRVYYVDN